MNVKGESIISLYSGVPKNFPSKRFPKKKKKTQHAQHIQKLSNRERQNQRKTKKNKKKKGKKEEGRSRQIRIICRCKGYFWQLIFMSFSLHFSETFWWVWGENTRTPPLFVSSLSLIKYPLKIFYLHFSILNFSLSLKSFQTNKPKEWAVFSFVIYV